MRKSTQTKNNKGATFRLKSYETLQSFSSYLIAIIKRYRRVVLLHDTFKGKIQNKGIIAMSLIP